MNITTLLVAAFGGIFVTLGISDFMQKATQTQQKLRTIDERDRTFSRVRDIAKMGQAVVKSSQLSANLALKNCIVDDNCPTGETEFTLTDFRGNKVAGTTSSPAYYSMTGELCAAGGGKCILEAYTSFEAVCQSGVCPSPFVALMIHVTLKSSSPGALFSSSGLMERSTKAYTKSGVSYLATPVFLTRAELAGGINVCPPKQSVYMATCVVPGGLPLSQWNHAPFAVTPTSGVPLPGFNCSPLGDACLQVYGPTPQVCETFCNVGGTYCMWYALTPSVKLCTNELLPSCAADWYKEVQSRKCTME
jgi:hypothetical protein